MNSSPNPYPQSRLTPSAQSPRPATIAELARRAAVDDIWDERQELKPYLRLAEKFRNNGRALVEKGDFEGAFVEYARAATLVLDKLPTHRDYLVKLSEKQREWLGENGQKILDSLSQIKPALVDRYENWRQQHPDEAANAANLPDLNRLRIQEEEQKELERRQAHERQLEMERRAVEEEAAKWRRQREEAQRRDEEDKARARADRDRMVKGPRDAIVAAAAAAERLPDSSRDYTFSRPVAQINGYHQSGAPPQPTYDVGLFQKHQQQQEEMKKREEEILRRRSEERRMYEQNGIAKRQQEADAAAHAVRQSISVNSSGSSSLGDAQSYSQSTPSQFQQPVDPTSFQYGTPTKPQYAPSSSSTVRAPRALSSRPPSFLDQFNEGPLIMPLESPTRYEGDSTDSETVTNTAQWRRTGKQKQAADKTPTRAPARSPSYPPPVTTTSPPPPNGHIMYPQLMSLHQKKQGYFPSLNSMFVPPSSMMVNPASLLFGGEPNQNQYDPRSLYSIDMLPPPSAPANTQAQYPYGMPQSNPAAYQQPSQYPTYPGPSRAAPPVPTQPQAPIPNQSTPSRVSRSEDTGAERFPDLKTVNCPRECLPRFLSIAALNTSMNKETCGLLLGKDKGEKFVVTTLLIPKQHSTSDTCTMDEEELVLQFTEERNLITLGWIHTHPSQSCFMSSVDLHTHSGFQRMLPESFAVVCAPKSNPNFGIFRLTDPPGLKTVLECKAKEAFHPHPDLPIYTDADKGHVQMKDISLEIVDLR